MSYYRQENQRVRGGAWPSEAGCRANGATPHGNGCRPHRIRQLGEAIVFGDPRPRAKAKQAEGGTLWGCALTSGGCLAGDGARTRVEAGALG